MANNSTNHFERLQKSINHVYLYIRFCPFHALGLRFQTSVVDRYPKTDHHKSPLADAVAAFCQPEGAIIRMNYIRPTFIAFVLTNTEGEKMYAVSVTFYEKMSPQLIHSTQESLTLTMGNASYVPNWPLSHKGDFYASKSACILSYHPFLNSFLECLKELYKISASPSAIPIERYIYNLVEQVQTPIPAQLSVELQWAHNKIIFEMPHFNDFPLADVEIERVFSCIDIDNVILIFRCLLSEVKVVFFSQFLTLLTNVIETFVSFLFPLRWNFAYIPILPWSVFGILDAPVPLLVGLHSSRVQSHFYGEESEMVLVNIDEGTVHVPSSIKNQGRDAQNSNKRGRKQSTMANMETSGYSLIDFPKDLERDLKSNLKKYGKVDSVPQLDAHDVEAAFSLRAALREEIYRDEAFSARGVRASFLLFFINLLGFDFYDYVLEKTMPSMDDFVSPRNHSRSISSEVEFSSSERSMRGLSGVNTQSSAGISREKQYYLNTTDFMRHQPKRYHDMLKTLLASQAFSKLLEDIYADNDHMSVTARHDMLFFQECCGYAHRRQQLLLKGTSISMIDYPTLIQFLTRERERPDTVKVPPVDTTKLPPNFKRDMDMPFPQFTDPWFQPPVTPIPIEPMAIGRGTKEKEGGFPDTPISAKDVPSFFLEKKRRSSSRSASEKKESEVGRLVIGTSFKTPQPGKKTPLYTPHGPLYTPRNGGPTQVSASGQRYSPQKYKSERAWICHLLLQLYQTWFTLQTVLADSINEPERLIDDMIAVLFAMHPIKSSPPLSTTATIDRSGYHSSHSSAAELPPQISPSSEHVFRAISDLQMQRKKFKISIKPSESIYKCCLVICGKFHFQKHAQRVLEHMKQSGTSKRVSKEVYGAWATSMAALSSISSFKSRENASRRASIVAMPANSNLGRRGKGKNLTSALLLASAKSNPPKTAMALSMRVGITPLQKPSKVNQIVPQRERQSSDPTQTMSPRAAAQKHISFGDDTDMGAHSNSDESDNGSDIDQHSNRIDFSTVSICAHQMCPMCGELITEAQIMALWRDEQYVKKLRKDSKPKHAHTRTQTHNRTLTTPNILPNRNELELSLSRSDDSKSNNNPRLTDALSETEQESDGEEILCPYCVKGQFIPTLRFRYSFEPSSQSMNNNGDRNESSPMEYDEEITVTYYSPLLLLTKLAYAVGHSNRFQFSYLHLFAQNYPNIFWNSFYYFYSEKLPLDYLLFHKKADRPQPISEDHEEKKLDTNDDIANDDNDDDDDNDSVVLPRLRPFIEFPMQQFTYPSNDKLAELIKPILSDLERSDFRNAMEQWLLYRRRIKADHKLTSIWNLSLYIAMCNLGMISRCANESNFIKQYNSSLKTVDSKKFTIKIKDRVPTERHRWYTKIFNHPSIALPSLTHFNDNWQ